MDKYKLARIAYAAYGAVTDFKNFQGNQMPEFDNLPEKIKEAWKAASEKIYEIGYKESQEYTPDEDCAEWSTEWPKKHGCYLYFGTLSNIDKPKLRKVFTEILKDGKIFPTYNRCGIFEDKGAYGLWHFIPDGRDFEKAIFDVDLMDAIDLFRSLPPPK